MTPQGVWFIYIYIIYKPDPGPGALRVSTFLPADPPTMIHPPGHPREAPGGPFLDQDEPLYSILALIFFENLLNLFEKKIPPPKIAGKGAPRLSAMGGRAKDGSHLRARAWIGASNTRFCTNLETQAAQCFMVPCSSDLTETRAI